MNHENFDTESAELFPLSKTRMAELQSDIQVPLKVLATMLPKEDCIVAGCEAAGAAGYAVVGLSDGNGGTVYEVIEVRAGVAGTYLNLNEESITALNGDGEDVVVRRERWLSWGYNAVNTLAPALTYASMKRLWVKKARQDDNGWTACANGTNWNAGTGGSVLRVAYSGGRVHLSGNLIYQPYLRVTQGLIDLGYFSGWGDTPTVGSLVRATTQQTTNTATGVLSALKQTLEVSFVGNTMRLPSGYRPTGDVLVPVVYNGTPACGIVGSDGVLTLDKDPEIGDTLKIDTYFEL